MNNTIEPFLPPRHCQLPPLSGHIGSQPEDFIVEEIPAYPLSGEGEHVFLWVEKRNLNTTDVVKRISQVSGIRDRDIGYAGMKDKNAITRQWFSFVSKSEDCASFDLGDGVKILQATRHNNKLRTGHLIGNRFEIALLDCASDDLPRAEKIAEELRKTGLPNYFGAQRFGRGGRNLEQALAWLDALAPKSEETQSAENTQEVERSRRRSKKKKGGRFENKMHPSVLQSEFFNRYTAARLKLPDTLLKGESVRLDNSAKHFVVEDAEAEASRLLEGDIHLSGALPGPKTLQSHSQAAELENAIFEEMNFDEVRRQSLSSQAPGARRDLIIIPENLTITELSPGRIVLAFHLPSGSFATQVVREFCNGDWLNPRAGAPTPSSND